MTFRDDIVWPADWRAMPLWSMFERIKDVGHPHEEMLSVYRDYGVVKKDERADNFNVTAENRNIYQLVDVGWLVVNRMKAWQGSVGISPYRGIVSGHYICFRPRHAEDPCFLNWLLRSSAYVLEFSRMSRGVRPNQVEIDNDALRALPVRLPPYEQQRVIADHLNNETARIDALVARKQALLDRLDERIDAMVGEAIGDSALAGRAGPAQEVRKLLARRRRPAIEAQVVTAFRDGQVTARALRRAEGFTEAWTDNATFQGVRRGDVVVHGLDGFAGAIGAAEVDGICSPVYHVIEPLDGGDPDFYGRLLHVLAVTGYLGLFAVSTRERAVDFRNWDLFGRIPIPVVSVEKQREVGRRIRALRPLRSAIERSRELALEHRQALITAAVTGELEITGV